MAKKPTLKHAQPNGVIATRQTARTYSHVLLRKRNAAALIADQRANLASDLKREERNSRDWYAHLAAIAAAGLGGIYPHPKTNSIRVDQRNMDESTKFLAANPDVEQFVLARNVALAERFAANVAALETCEFGWEVISWHSRADLANPSYVGPGDEFMVEAVNNGVRQS